MTKLPKVEGTSAETKPIDTATDAPIVQDKPASVAPPAKRERPSRGGAFIRQPDGTLVPEVPAATDKEA